ncbi:M28 family peptidase [Catelliglobosispora koreensis]|uniref:M28 family peptidase n=1 Tax=Catelliglobosispora koreensis TaxID=129052 RepID=UPI000380802F|nr:M28 family peptidase [Catelliglobosispora koreensis]
MNSRTAEPVVTGSALASEALRRMQGVIARLAADDFTGRQIGTPGGQAASAWLAAHLESLGAQTHLDSFALHGAVKRLSAMPRLRWESPAGARNLSHRRDFAEHLASASVPFPVTGPLSGIPRAGAWVLDSSYSAVRAAALTHAGAVGLLLPRGTDDAGWMPKMIAGPAACPLPVLSVRRDVFDEMAFSVREGHQSVVSAAVPLQTVNVVGTNVYGVFREPAPGALSVWLTAHFDGVGDDPDGTRFPAAGDNASGVAVVLQAAQRLHATLAPHVGLAVALLDGEEAGAHGSAHHAPQLPSGTALINVDGAAQLHEAAAIEAGGPAQALVAALDQAGRQTGIPLRGKAMPSDNRRYAAAGHAAIGIGMGIPAYQTPAEVPQTVEPETLLAAAELVTATVNALAA